MIGNNAQTALTTSNSIVIGSTAYTSQLAPSATWISLSDARDKTCVQTLTAGLDFIRQVYPVKFNWKVRNTDSTHPRWMMPDSGFLAQDLVNLLKNYSAAQGYDAKAHLKLGLDSDPDQFFADPGKLIPVVVKAIQDLANLNDALTTRVAALEAKLNTST
jgi:hypothetical protein